MKKILIIEDDPKHLQDARNFFSKIEGVKVTYQESYEPFNNLTRANKPYLSDNFKNYDGVISDIYFPGTPGEETQPIGASVLVQCHALNVPCVLCTSGYHHGDHYQWICDMQYGLKEAGWNMSEMIDSCHVKEDSLMLENKGPKGEEVITKSWEKAWEELQEYF